MGSLLNIWCQFNVLVFLHSDRFKGRNTGFVFYKKDIWCCVNKHSLNCKVYQKSCCISKGQLNIKCVSVLDKTKQTTNKAICYQVHSSLPLFFLSFIPEIWYLAKYWFQSLFFAMAFVIKGNSYISNSSKGKLWTKQPWILPTELSFSLLHLQDRNN